MRSRGLLGEAPAFLFTLDTLSRTKSAVPCCRSNTCCGPPRTLLSGYQQSTLKATGAKPSCAPHLPSSPMTTFCPSLPSSRPSCTLNPIAPVSEGTVWFAKDTTIGLTESLGASLSVTSLLREDFFSPPAFGVSPLLRCSLSLRLFFDFLLDLSALGASPGTMGADFFPIVSTNDTESVWREPQLSLAACSRWSFARCCSLQQQQPMLFKQTSCVRAPEPLTQVESTQ